MVLNFFLSGNLFLCVLKYQKMQAASVLVLVVVLVVVGVWASGPVTSFNFNSFTNHGVSFRQADPFSQFTSGSFGRQSRSNRGFGRASNNFVTQPQLSRVIALSTIPTSGSRTFTTTYNAFQRQCAQGSSCTWFHSCPSSRGGPIGSARINSKPNHFCMLENGFTGVCCAGGERRSSGSSRQSNTAFTRVPANIANNFQNTFRQTARTTNSSPAGRSSNIIHFEVNEIRRTVNNLELLENELHSSHIMPQQNTKEFAHQNFFGGNDVTLKEMQAAFQVLQAFINFSKKEKLTPEDILNSNFDLRNTDFAAVCGTPPSCNASYPYRLPDGTCNNLINVSQGKAVSTFARLLPPDYADGISEPRKAKDKSELPNARLISLSISPESNIENNRYSLMLAQFGQFIDHDITRTGTTKTHNDDQISCCTEEVLRNARLQHPACFPIEVPDQDSFLRAEAQQCINFVRSAPAINPRCRFGPREQLNQLSSYMDGNNVYGASEKEAKDLRAFTGGRLKVSSVNSQEFLPMKPANDTNCQLPKNSQMRCFAGGDNRVNEVVDLAVLHNAWMREHNRIAGQLSVLNPHWNDNKLYEETKRIVIAQLQHIVYDQFLPLILGQRAYAHFGLGLSSAFSNRYNPAIDVTVLNEFSTAAYRLHSLIQGMLNLNSADNRVLARVPLREQFNNPRILYHQGGYEMRIAGLTGQPIQRFDNFFSREITNHLFQIPGKRFGLDLVALNVQRGRDHGLPGYTHYRDICGLSPVKSFSDLKRIFSNGQVANVMASLYRDVEDIDLFIAGSSEKVLPGSVVGPTFACIIGEQFRRFKEGDRFWYENGPNEVGSFTAAQLSEIKKTTLSRVLCDNSQIEIMQKNAFLMPSSSNPKVSCQSNHIPRINLRAWEE